MDSLFDLRIVGTGVVDQFGRNTFNGLDQCQRTTAEGFQSVDVYTEAASSQLYDFALGWCIELIIVNSVGSVSRSITDVLQVFAEFGDPVIPCRLQWDPTRA